VASRREAVEAYVPYVEAQLARGVPLHRITRHMLGLYHAQPGGRIWRQILTVEGAKAGADASVIWRGLAAVEAQAARLREAALRSEQVVDGVNHALTARINAIVEA
jgi:tRNA-dihydrouridine synthase A